MRILHVIPSLAACHGGPSTVLPLMEAALKAEGLEIETIATDDDGPGARNGKGDGTAREENGVLRRYFPKQTEFYKTSLPLARWTRREARRFDVVHIHALFSFPSIAAARVARSAAVPYVIRPLGVLNQYGVTQRRKRLKRLSLRWVEGPVLRDAAAVHFTLDAEREEAEGLGIDFRPVVIPLGIEPPPRPATGTGGDKSILFLSRIDPKKNLESLLDAWSGVHSRHPDWRLVIAGSGDAAYLDELRQRAAALGIASSVEWAGQVAGERKARLMADAAIFTLPSHSENFGIAAAEAMLAGKACVFTPGVAVGAEAAKSEAARLAEATPGALAEALEGLILDERAREALAGKARRFAEAELSAATMGRRLKELYERIAAPCQA